MIKPKNIAKRVKTPYVSSVWVLATVAAIWYLRQNNLTMIELRQAVIDEDAKSGSIMKVEPKLEALGNHVLNHMNTNLGSPLELPGTYNAAVERIREQVEQSGSANSSIYAEAQRLCEDPNVLLTVRAQCIQDYVTSRAAPGSLPQELVFPDKALYSYNFSSPVWSPDIAGFSVLLSALSLIVLVGMMAKRVVAPLIDRWVNSDPLE